MDNKNIAGDISTIMKSANSLMQKLQTGEGLNLPEDKKKEFMKAMKEKGADKLIVDLKNKMEQFKKVSKAMNNGANN